MQWNKFLQTWEGTRAENRFNRLVILGLIVLVLVFGSVALMKKTIVTVQPYTLTQEAWVTTNDASQNYKEAWGQFFAAEIGNVTPATVDFIKDRIAIFLAPSIYHDVIDLLEIQASQIKEDRVSLRFEPRFVEYEPESKKVFVWGLSFTAGANGKPKRDERTYEFVIAIGNFAPRLDYIDTYVGKPKTQRILDQIKAKEESKQK
jgi:conjugal transfer pilus assembly protein TraE